MRDTPQACLHAAQHNWFGIFEILTNQIGINDYRAIGAAVIFSARRQIIAVSLFLCRGIIGHQRIHAAAGDAPEKFWFAEARDIRGAFYLGLGDNGYFISRVGKRSADYRHANVRAVDIGVTRDQNNIRAVPA
ncbi:MAG: hypothetical protein BWY90_01661 [Deltaproteobacteria bacterium ADurb.BinA014]|nr:MAG: hypothetical protein BWY90_01661 [Deltaproteobacteria bacterium ADurb.BinA014]